MTGGVELSEELLLVQAEGLGQRVRQRCTCLLHRSLQHRVETRPLVPDLQELYERGEVAELLREHGHVFPNTEKSNP